MGKEEQLVKIEISNRELLDLFFFLYLLTLLFLVVFSFVVWRRQNNFALAISAGPVCLHENRSGR